MRTGPYGAYGKRYGKGTIVSSRGLHSRIHVDLHRTASAVCRRARTA